MPVTMSDIARLAGVSRPVVSAVIHGRTNCRVSAAKRQVIMDLIRELDYHPNRLASSLRLGQKAEIGVFLPPWESLLILQLTRSLVHWSQALDLPLQFCYDLNPESYAGFVSAMTRERHPALISYVPFYPSQSQEQLLSSHLSSYISAGGRVISLNHFHWDMPHSSTIQLDEALGGRLAAQYLRRQGCASFVVFSQDMGLMSLRYGGFARELGMRPPLFHYDTPVLTRESIRILRDLLPTLPRPVGIYSLNHNASLFVANLDALGWRIQQDYALVSYDYDGELGDTFPQASLKQPFDEIGRLAMEQVSAALRGEDLEDRLLSPTLIQFPTLSH